MMQFIRPALTRRAFLGSVAALASGAMLPRLSFANSGGSARLVVVVLRGALDGLAAVPAYGDPAYAELRRELAIGVPGSADGALALDGTFALHPALGFMHERYRAQELIVFHAAASPYRDRSHFDGQIVLENGLAQPLGTADGWLNRALAQMPRLAGPKEHAVAISQNVPLILRGKAAVLSKSPLQVPDVDAELLARLADLYSKDDWFASRLSEAVEGETMAGDGDTSAAKDRIGNAARLAAALMRNESGPEVAVIEATGWDTHANQGAAKGILAQRLGSLDGALRVLADGLGPIWPQTAVLVVTEFGRTAAVNGTRGTDHGTGGCAFLVGGAVHGGRVVADWPGLRREALLDNRDLRPTLDLRSIYKTVLSEHMNIGAGSLATHVFPNSDGARPLAGLIRA